MKSKARPAAAAAAAAAAADTAAAAAAAAVRFRLRITTSDIIAIGPGKIALVEAIDRAGSISAAARELGMSYRRAWLLLDELNRALQHPAVASAQGGALGGGSVLTAYGRELIALYRRIEETAARACSDDIERLLGMLVR